MLAKLQLLWRFCPSIFFVFLGCAAWENEIHEKRCRCLDLEFIRTLVIYGGNRNKTMT